MANIPLHTDANMIERMENDLIAKVTASYTGVAGVPFNVYGAFSLDHLETLVASQLCNDIAVGIGFLEALPAQKPVNSINPDRGNSFVMTEFRFVIVLAVPTEESCGTRHNATKLLTLLRGGILGKPVDNDMGNRTWNFVSEKPEIGASTKQMLYYAQVWQVALPNLGVLS